MKVPFIDFSGQIKDVRDEVDAGIKGVLDQGNYILGQPVKDFEAEFAKFCECQYGIGVNSGTDALHFAVRALDIQEGDEVIVPAFTYIASALGISYTGAKPVFVDIESETYNLDPEKIEAAITDKTKAIMVVHLYGQAAEMDPILAIAKKHNLAVIEDAAQAHGALYNNKRVGSFGDISCFSFYPTKGLGACGDGGIVCTNNEELKKKVEMFRDYGRIDRYEHMIIGYNSRLDTMQAVILSAKLKHLDKWNKMRADVAAQYIDQLSDVDAVKTPVTKDNRTHTYQTFAVGVPKRERVMEKLTTRQIGNLIHYPIPIHLQKAYKDLGYKKGDFPVSEKFAEQELSLPIFPHMKKEQIQYVTSNLKELIRNG